MVSLESTKLFKGLSGAELEFVRSVAQEKAFAPGEVIFREGDPGDGVYVVKEGVVQISTIVSGDERRPLSHLGPGEFFGEMAVLDCEPRSATASADEHTSVWFIPSEKVLELLERNPRLAVGLVREISKRLREFNRQYIQEALQAERLTLVGRFARSIVHDLKNPLNVIGLSAELIEMNGIPPESRSIACGRIRKQVERITNMINELLEFTRGSQTSVVLASSNFDAFVTQAIDELRPEAALRAVTIEFENPPPSALVPINPPRLTRVFQNLVHNATDAMPDGGKIILRFRSTEKEIVTEIEDTGPGIASEISDKLFQVFASYGKINGTGLGLSICKKIIEDHHGKIYTRSEPGRGAIFVFTLPRPAG